MSQQSLSSETQKELEEFSRTQLSCMFGISTERLVREAHLVDELDLDSIDTIELLTQINDHFGYKLSPFDFEGCATLGNFLDRLIAKAAQQKVS